jgi:peptidoglycan/xylan/chitin deacetylase (PgdA/CDA1 family)
MNQLKAERAKMKVIAIVIGVVFMIFTSCEINIYGGSNNCELEETLPEEFLGGIALGFDDYSPVSWSQHFDLFDQYQAKVTFFCIANEVTEFMLNAQNRGHEIGYHTISHPTLSRVSREQFFEETISCINVFKEGGIELTTFAYPYGIYEAWMHDELLQYYKVVRGFRNFPEFSSNFSLDKMKYGLVNSRSIDNVNYSTEHYYENMINMVLMEAKMEKTIAVLTSHQISSADWGITTERLEYVLKKGKELGLNFYTYKDLQNWE